MTSEIAKKTLHKLVELFRDPDKLVGGLAKSYIKGEGKPSDRWSWGNRLLCWLEGTDDARTFNQWKKVKRYVNKGTKAFYILAPCTVKVKVDKAEQEEDAETEKVRLVGFRGIPVFSYEDTHGSPLPTHEPKQLPPLMDVAKRWGVNVTYAPKSGAAYGAASVDGTKIRLFTHDEAVFYHELMHVADGKLHTQVGGQDPDQEAVAELGAAVLARLYGGRIDRAAWEYISIYQGDPAKAAKKLLSRIEKCLDLIFS